MAQPKDARLTGELAREVCQRTASAATIEGSISTLGSQYVVGLKAVNCRTGDLLGEEQVTADRKEQVLRSLGAAATKLRKKLGESLASVQKYDAPPENVTTPSLEALPIIHAAVALQGGRATTKAAEKAIGVLAAAAPYELGSPVATVGFDLYAIYLRGDAYVAAHQGPAAVTEFQKILDHPGVVANEPIGALAHLGLGRAYALSGDSIKAKAAYQDFLTLWKDADLDIPIYKQAKAEYARLK